MSQISDENMLKNWVKQAIDANPKAARDVKNGKEKAIGALVGFVMKKSKGRANPAVLNKIIKKTLR
jgi:aspartyl-tRNA(Asn)/glutamyl-tRNA(Gln) amidotransferase subunit B